MQFLISCSSVVLPEEVEARHFFLQQLVNPYVIWGIRCLCIAAGCAALIVYFVMKNKKGE